MPQKDLYSLLEIDRTASAEEIKKSYRKLAMKYHPDKNPGDKKAEETFKELTSAYEILSDPTKRQNYDRFGFTGNQSGPSGFEGFGGFRQRQGGFSSSNTEDSFQDIFGDLFGDVFGAKRSTGKKQKRRGADLRYTVNLSLEEAASGTEKVISYLHNKDGMEVSNKLSVKIPAGVNQGQRLKLAGKGDEPLGGAAGDLYVVINLTEHQLFKRDKDDLLIDVPISYVDAILGSEIEVPTLSGRVLVKAPAGTHSGQILRVKGRGFPKAGGFESGDMLVRLHVDTPQSLSAEEKSLIQELKKFSKDTPQVKVFQEKLKSLNREKK